MRVALNVKALWLESSKLISNKGKSKESTKEIVASVTLKRFDVYAIELCSTLEFISLYPKTG